MTQRPRSLELYRERLAAVRAEAAAAISTSGADSARTAQRLMDALTAARSPSPLACRPGCASCCHVHVDVTRPELDAIAAHVRTHLSPSERHELRVRLEGRVRLTAPLSDDARWAARLPCGLLDDAGRCAVYAARPLRCRAFHSTDAAACRAALRGDSTAEPATEPALSRLLEAVEGGYDDALSASAIAAGVSRLESGLLPLLEDTPASPGST